MRLAFVGQGVYFRPCSLELPADGIEPAFLDFRFGARSGPLLSELRRLDPDVVLAFRPEIIPPGLFESLRALTIGYLTEPLPRGSEGGHHKDLGDRLRWLEKVDPGNFDRVVSFDPLIAQTVEDMLPVWRSLPLPVADTLFLGVRERASPPRLLFLGRSTEHRERLLAPIKTAHRITHVGHGLSGPGLARFLERADVQINLHNHPYPSFENRVSVALAAAHLVISEPLSPTHGLRPGEEYLEATDPESLLDLVEKLERDPGVHLDVQRAGRRAAERFRASRVYPELIRDAVADVEARGSRRRRA